MGVMIGWWLLSIASAGTARIGLFVGNNIGFGQDEPLAYAEEEARRVARIFQDMGDLDRERTTVLQGASAGALREAIQSIEGQAREIAARGDDAMVLFYYSGHATNDGLHMAGSMFPLPALQRWLQTSVADVRVAFVDACESGSLTRARGGRPVDHVAVSVDETLTASGLAIVSSTGPLSAARESASFGGGVFSRSLITGLRGSADRDSDGVITLDEAYRYAFEQTVTGTAKAGTSIQRPEYRYEISGIGQVVLTRIPARASGLTLPEELEGVYTVVAVGTGQVVARVDKQPGETHRLSLPAGRYVVRKLRQEDVLLAELDLVWGGDRWISDDQMSSVALGDPMARGGWRPRPIQVGIRGVGTTPRVAGQPFAGGAELALRGRVRPRLYAGLDVGYSRGTRYEWVGRLDADAFYVGAGLHTLRSLGRVDVWLGGGLMGTLARQRVQSLEIDGEDVDGEIFTAEFLSPGAFLSGGLHVPVGPGFGVDLGARTHAFYALVNEDPKVLVEGTLQTGISVSFRTRKVARARRADERP